MQNVPPKLLYLPTIPHGVTIQKTNIDIFTAVRTSNNINMYNVEDGCLLGCCAM
jgi:hypothetical protein